jgi:argininosuccinate lyase
MKLWAGRFHKELDSRVNDFNSSVSFDCRMYREDIEGSMAHAAMLSKCGIIDPGEAQKIIDALAQIREEIDSGSLVIDHDAEDIHMFIEQTLTARIGDAGKRLHTARSRNDQVALDIRLYLRRETDVIKTLVLSLLAAISKKAKTNIVTVMPGYTHLQRAQPVTYAHYLMAYAAMLMRDSDRLDDCRRRINVMPLGSGALASTTILKLSIKTIGQLLLPNIWLIAASLCWDKKIAPSTFQFLSRVDTLSAFSTERMIA